MEGDEQAIKAHNREHKFSFRASHIQKLKGNGFCTHLGNNQNECVKRFGLKASMNIGMQL